MRTPIRIALFLMFCQAALQAAGAVDASTLDNKVLIGYQGWFTCPEDGSQRWTHWSRGVPTADTLTVELYPDLTEVDADGGLKNIMAAAREAGRTPAIEYDISGGNAETFGQTLKDDWVYLVDELKVSSHPNYQGPNGKPVLSIWGMGLNDG